MKSEKREKLKSEFKDRIEPKGNMIIYILLFPIIALFTLAWMVVLMLVYIVSLIGTAWYNHTVSKYPPKNKKGDSC